MIEDEMYNGNIMLATIHQIKWSLVSDGTVILPFRIMRNRQ